MQLAKQGDVLTRQAADIARFAARIDALERIASEIALLKQRMASSTLSEAQAAQYATEPVAYGR